MTAQNRFFIGARRRLTTFTENVQALGERAMSSVRWFTVVIALSTLGVLLAAEENANSWALFSAAALIWVLGVVFIFAMLYPGRVATFLVGEATTRRIPLGQTIAQTMRIVAYRLMWIALVPAAAAAWTTVVPVVDRLAALGGLLPVAIFAFLAVVAPAGFARRAILVSLSLLSLVGTSVWAHWDAGNEEVAVGIALVGIILTIVVFNATTHGRQINLRLGRYADLLRTLVVLGLIGGVIWLGLRFSGSDSTPSTTTSGASFSTTPTASPHGQCREADWVEYDHPNEGYAYYEIDVELSQGECVWFDLPHVGRWTDAKLLPGTLTTWFEVYTPSTGSRGILRCNDGQGSLEGGAPYFRVLRGEGTAVVWAWNAGQITDPWQGQPCRPSSED